MVCYGCAPSLPLDTAVFSRSDGEGEGMTLRGLVLLFYFARSRFDGKGEGMTLREHVRW